MIQVSSFTSDKTFLFAPTVYCYFFPLNHLLARKIVKEIEYCSLRYLIDAATVKTLKIQTSSPTKPQA